jgi:NAD(P)-dependent dehydrogenase (short-subunit alcohol dehydrogenase family)
MIKNNILITGSAGFLGSIYADHLSKANNVFAVDIDFKKLNILKKKNNEINIFRLDISNEKKVKSFFHKLKRKNIFINVLINNAAIDSVPAKGKNYIDINQWNLEINVGLTGSFLMTKYFGEEMIKKRNGKIINIGSDLSVVAPTQDIYKKIYTNYTKPVTYSVVKHGLLGMTKYFASLYADRNVNVNMLSPGPIFNNHNKKFINQLIKFIPKKRMGNPEDLISGVDFLIDRKNSYMTGQNIIIDGGRTII